MRRNPFTIAMLLVGLAAAPALAHGRGEGGAPLMDPGMLDRVAHELNLDAATTAKIKDKLVAAKKQHIQLKADHDAAEVDLRRMLDEENPNRDAVFKQLDLVAQKRVAMEKLKIGTLLDVRAMLTPDQRAKLKEMHGRMHGPRGHDRDDDDDDNGPPPPKGPPPPPAR
jgi:Spy/CpxP family protein refolding chaperone